MRLGVGSTGAPRQSDGLAAPHSTAPPNPPFTGTPRETEAGKSCWDGGRGLGQATFWAAVLLVGGGGRLGPRPVPQPMLVPTPSDHPQLEASLFLVHSSYPSPPPPLSLCFSSLALRSLPPSSLCGCLSLPLRLISFFACLGLWLSLSLGLCLGLSSLLAHFHFLSLSGSLFSPSLQHPPPRPPTHTSQPCLRHPQGWQVGGAAAERG